MVSHGSMPMRAPPGLGSVLQGDEAARVGRIMMEYGSKMPVSVFLDTIANKYWARFGEKLQSAPYELMTELRSNKVLKRDGEGIVATASRPGDFVLFVSCVQTVLSEAATPLSAQDVEAAWIRYQADPAYEDRFALLSSFLRRHEFKSLGGVLDNICEVDFEMRHSDGMATRVYKLDNNGNKAWTTAGTTESGEKKTIDTSKGSKMNKNVKGATTTSTNINNTTNMSKKGGGEHDVQGDEPKDASSASKVSKLHYNAKPFSMGNTYHDAAFAGGGGTGSGDAFYGNTATGASSIYDYTSGAAVTTGQHVLPTPPPPSAAVYAGSVVGAAAGWGNMPGSPEMHDAGSYLSSSPALPSGVDQHRWGTASPDSLGCGSPGEDGSGWYSPMESSGWGLNEPVGLYPTLSVSSQNSTYSAGAAYNYTPSLGNEPGSPEDHGLKSWMLSDAATLHRAAEILQMMDGGAGYSSQLLQQQMLTLNASMTAAAKGAPTAASKGLSTGGGTATSAFHTNVAGKNGNFYNNNMQTSSTKGGKGPGGSTAGAWAGDTSAANINNLTGTLNTSTTTVWDGLGSSTYEDAKSWGKVPPPPPPVVLPMAPTPNAKGKKGKGKVGSKSGSGITSSSSITTRSSAAPSANVGSSSTNKQGQHLQSTTSTTTGASVVSNNKALGSNSTTGSTSTTGNDQSAAPCYGAAPGLEQSNPYATPQKRWKAEVSAASSGIENSGAKTTAETRKHVTPLFSPPALEGSWSAGPPAAPKATPCLKPNAPTPVLKPCGSPPPASEPDMQKLHKAILKFLDEKPTASVDEAARDFDVKTCWKSVGRVPLWKLLKQFPSTVHQKQQPDGVWIIRRVTEEDSVEMPRVQ
ncbi:unnamed protein product [Amoebophrya sp. A25]|nr:unnamed protein product [Amoebophrya sp. A25]|eukprot:GSA25T00015881001.1